MAKLAELVVEFNANTAKFTAEMNKINTSMNGVSRSLNAFKSSMRTIETSAFVYLGKEILNAAAKMYTFGKSIASSLMDIDRQAKLIGVTTEQWQKWTYAAKMSDVSTEGLMMSMKFLSQNIMEARNAGSQADRDFKALGITGKTLDDVMLQLADIFKDAKDGEDKIAWATRLMGRSAMDVIPYFNQGGAAIKGLGEEAAKTGKIIDQDLIDAGTRAEDSFKRFEASLVSLKAQAAPLIEVFAAMLEKINAVIEAIKKVPKAWDIEAAGIDPLTGLPIPKSAKAVFKMEEGTTEPRRYGKILPTIPKAGGEGAQKKDAYDLYFDAVSKGQERLDNYMKVAYEQDFEDFKNNQQEKMEIAKTLEENLAKAYADRAAKQQKWMEAAYAGEKEAEEKRKEMRIRYADEELGTGPDSLQKRLFKIQIEMDKALTEGVLPENEIRDHFRRMKLDAIREWNDMSGIFQSVAVDMSRIWSDNFQDMLTGTKSFADGIQSIFASMGNYVLSTIMKMGMNYALFGNLAGKFASGSGLFGVIGASLKLAEGGVVRGYRPLNIPRFAGGAVVDRPTLAMVGEGGEKEYITPESKMGGRQPINIFNITDQRQFDQYMASSRGAATVWNIIGSDPGRIKRLLR